MPKKEKEPNLNIVSSEWQNQLEETLISTDEWKCQVSLLAGSTLDDEYNMEKFYEASLSNTRFVIHSISYEDTLKMVKRMGNKDESTSNTKLFSIANDILVTGIELPQDIIALLIKHQIIELKNKHIYIKNSKKEMQSGMEKESLIMMNDAMSEKIPNKSSKTLNSKKKNVLPQTVPSITLQDRKYHTNLRTASEEWRDKIYIEDSPCYGSDMYVALCGFRNFDLINELLKIKVPLIAIVEIKSKSISSRENKFEPPSSVTNKSSRLAKIEIDLKKFWDNHFKYESIDIFKNIIFISFHLEVPSKNDNENFKIYDQVSYLLYDIQELVIQHSLFIQRMNVINVIDEENPPLIEIDSMKLYKGILDEIPLEFITVELILYAMVEQIAVSSHGNDSIVSDNISKTNSSINSDLYTQKDDMAFLVTHENNEMSAIATREINACFQKFESISIDNKIKSQDEKKSKSPEFIPYKHIFQNNLDNIQESVRNQIYCISIKMLKHMPLAQLWDRFLCKASDSENATDFRIRLLSACIGEENISLQNTARLINLMICDNIVEDDEQCDDQQSCINNAQPQKKTFIKPLLTKYKSTVFGGHCQIIDLRQNNENCVTLLSDRKFENTTSTDDILKLCEKTNILKNLSECDTFEEMDVSSMLLVLNESFNIFDKVYFKYCEITNNILLVFCKNKNNNRFDTVQWHEVLPSPVTIKDYFEFAFNEKYYCTNISDSTNISESNKSFDDINPRGKKCFDEFNNSKSTPNLKNDMILQYSLKYMENHNTTIHRESITSRNVKASSEIAESLSRKSSVIDELIIPTEIDRNIMETSVRDELESFIGYNLGEKCAHTSGLTKTFYLGMRRSKISLTLENNFTNKRFIRVQNNISTHNLFIYSHIDEVSGTISKVDKLRFLLKNGMNIVYHENNTKTCLNREIDVKVNNTQIDNMYDISISWQNGLIIEPLWDISYKIPPFIRQFFIQQNQTSVENQDLFRYYCHNGKVIVYKRNGLIEILCPDGCTVICYKFNSNICNIEALLPSIDSQTIYHEELNSEMLSNIFNSMQYECEAIFNDKVSICQITTAAGMCLKFKDQTLSSSHKILSRTVTDYLRGNIYTSRLDGITILIDKRGTQTVTFSDNTKIISKIINVDQRICSEDLSFTPSPNDRPESISKIINVDQRICSEDLSYAPSPNDQPESIAEDFVEFDLEFTFEHPNYATVHYFNSPLSSLKLEMCNTYLEIKQHGIYYLQLDEHSSANFNSETMIVNDISENECGHKNISLINLLPDENSKLLETEQCNGRKLVIDNIGNFSLVENQDFCKRSTHHQLCDKHIPSAIHRFIALKRDLSGEEYIHRESVNNFKYEVRNEFTITTTFNDNYDKHIQNESWLMSLNSKTELSSVEGKQAYSWMRPYYVKPITRKSFPDEFIYRIFRKVDYKLDDLTSHIAVALKKYMAITKENSSFQTEINIRNENHSSTKEIVENLKRFLEDLVNTESYNTMQFQKKNFVRKFFDFYLQNIYDRIVEDFNRQVLRGKKNPKYFSKPI